MVELWELLLAIVVLLVLSWLANVLTLPPQLLPGEEPKPKKKKQSFWEYWGSPFW